MWKERENSGSMWNLSGNLIFSSFSLSLVTKMCSFLNLLTINNRTGLVESSSHNLLITVAIFFHKGCFYWQMHPTELTQPSSLILIIKIIAVLVGHWKLICTCHMLIEISWSVTVKRGFDPGGEYPPFKLVQLALLIGHVDSLLRSQFVYFIQLAWAWVSVAKP